MIRTLFWHQILKKKKKKSNDKIIGKTLKTLFDVTKSKNFCVMFYLWFLLYFISVEKCNKTSTARRDSCLENWKKKLQNQFIWWIILENLDFLICIQKIKVRYQCSQELFEIKKYSNLIGWEHALICPFQNTRLCLFLQDLPLKNQSQISSHQRDIKD